MIRKLGVLWMVLPLALAAPGVAAQTKQAAPPAKSKAQAKAKKAPQNKPETGIPKGALLTEEGYYRHTDAQGKTWIYRQTPWGIMKGEEKPQTPGTETTEGMTAVEDGDVIRFERPYPFGGRMRWEKKKTELTEQERAVWEKSRQAQKDESTTK